MAGISSKALSFGDPGNKRGFNGGNELQSKEFSDGSGLDMYDAVHRSYDQQLGIFRQIDPIADLSLRFSPYAFANNNPITFNDPLGLIADSTDKKGNVWHGLDDVSVKGVRKKNPKPFYWQNSTKSQRQEWDKNENTYWSRYLNHQSISQKGDPSSYKSRLGMYNRWSSEEQNYRAMQAWTVSIILSTPILTLSPGLLAVTTDLAGTKAVVSILAQGLIKGPRNIDIVGVAADAFTAPGLNGIISGGLNYTPFSSNKQLRFGWDKSASEFFIDASSGLVGGLAGDASWQPLNSLLKSGTEKSILYISTQLPVSTAQQAAPEVIKKD